jgi:hypothetical protein
LCLTAADKAVGATAQQLPERKRSLGKRSRRRRHDAPGLGPQTDGKRAVDEQSVAQEQRTCFYCLEGWVFIGSLDHDGEEVYEAVRCRKCGGTGPIHSLR